MPVEVILPKVDMDMESGVIAVWKVHENDTVRAGDVLCEIETNKALMEVEAPASGTIRHLSETGGDPIAVGTPIAWIYDSSEASPEAPADAPAAPGLDEMSTAATGPFETALEAPEPVGPAYDPAQPLSHRGIRATPLARRAARLFNVDLTSVVGSGPLGRIVEKDVAASATERAHPAATTESETPDAPTDAGLVAFTPLRKLMAQRMEQSTRTAPHFYLTAHIEMTALRKRLHDVAPDIERGTGSRPSITVMLAAIVGRLLVNHPLINASVEGDAVRLHPEAHIGIAMDRDGDLVVPVLRSVHTLTLSQVTQEFMRLREAVRRKSIRPEEMRGGTFTISNLAMYDVDAFTAIINPPQSAILAIGRTVDTPVGRDGHVVLRPMATLSLSSDHRVIDGVAAARFMADLRKAIEGAEAANVPI